MSDKKKKLLVTIDSSMTDKWRNNQGNMSSVQIDNSMLEKWQQEKTRLEQEQNKKQETQNTTQKTKQKEANEFESLNNSNIPTPEDLKNQNTSSNLKATSPVERLQNKTQAVIRSEEEMNEAKEKLLNTKKSDYVADWAKFRDEYTKAGGEIPEWVNKLLDKAIPIQATGKTYVNHVETALTEAGRGIAKDEDYIANIDLKEHPVKKLLLSSTGSTIATAKPEWVENLIDSADSFYQKKEKENERLSTLANSDQSPLGQSIGYINDNIAPTIGEMTPAIVTNAVTGGSSAIPSAITQFFVSNGSYYRDAEQRGMNEDEAFLYSKIMAGVEAGTEYITASNVNKTGKLFKNITNGDFSKSVKELGFKQALAKLGEDTVEKGFFKSLATDMLENAFQEAITEPINELVAGGVADKADWSNIGNRMLQSAINGGIVAGIMGGASVGIPSAQSVTNKMETNIQNGKEVTSGITSQEIQKAYNDTSKVLDTDKLMTDSIQQQGNKLQSLMQEIKSENAKQQNNTIEETTGNTIRDTQITDDDNLVSSAKKYNLDFEDLSIENSQKALNIRGITAKFDGGYFNSTDEGGKYILTTDNNGNVISREIILNPNANEETIIQEMTIHELTHDIIAGKTDESIKMYNEVLDYLKSDESFEKQKAQLEESYLNVRDENGNPIYTRNDSNFNKMIEEEAIAKTIQTKFGTQEQINNLVNYKPSIARTIYDWIIEKLNNITGGKIEKLYWRDVRNKFEKAFSQEGNYENIEIRHSKEITKNNTRYIKLDDNLFKNEDGSLKTPREAYNSLIGKTLTLDDGSKVKIVNKLENIVEPQKPKKMYNELSKRRPRGKGINDVSEIDNINKKINGNLDEAFESSDYIRTKTDIDNRHQEYNIKNFDTREVNIYDPNTQKAYKLTLSIAELTNGEKIAYAKKTLEPNDILTEIIKKETSTSSASKNGRYSRSDVPNNIIPQNNKKVKNSIDKPNSSIKYSVSADGSMKDSKTGKKIILDAETGSTDKTLLAIHNLTEDKLRGILELDGFPVPSIAITNPEINSHEEFGDITVIFNKNTINPANRQNEVYDRDVWSPTFPSVDYDINNSSIKKYITNNLDYDMKDSIIQDAVTRYMYDVNLSDMVDRYGVDKTLETLKDSNTLKYFYKTSVEKDSNYNPVMKQANYSNSDTYGNAELEKFLNEYKGEKALNDLSYQETLDLGDDIAKIIQERFYKDAEKLPDKKMQDSYKKLSNEVVDSFRNNFNKLYDFIYSANKMKQNGSNFKVIDEDATLKDISNQINQKDYKTWIDNTFGKMLSETAKGIRNDKDVFTPSGNRRSFEKLHDEYNLQNIVKAMTKVDTKAGQKTLFEGGFGKVSARLSNQFNSIEDIKNSENRISKKEEIQPKIDELRDKFNNDLHELSPYFTYSEYKSDLVSEMRKFENIQEAVFEFSGKENLSITNFKKVLDSFYGVDSSKIPTQKLQNIIDDLNEIKNLPTDYFEAKPQRAVDFDEVDTIVIPSDLSTEVKQQLKEKGIKTIEYDRNNKKEKSNILKSLDEYKFSNSSENFDQYLKNRIGKEGTRTSLKDIILPTKQDVIKLNNKNNSTKSISEKLKNIYPVELTDKEIESITKDIIANPTEEGILKALNDYRTTYIEEENSDIDTIKEIKTTIRNTKLDVSKLKDSITDYNDVRKSNFGKLKIGNDGMAVDTFYQYLANNYPEYFSGDVYNEADQLDEIIEFINEEQTNKTEYKMTDDDIKASGIIDAITKALNTSNNTNTETPEKNSGINKSSEEITKNSDKLVKRNKELYKQRYILEKEAQKLDRKIELSDSEKEVVKSLLNDAITENEIPNRYNKENIMQKYKNDKELSRVRKEIKQNKLELRKKYNELTDDVVNNISKIKDKSKGILYRRETAIRNVQDVVKDKALAQKINDVYFKPVLQNEAERTRFIKDNIKQIQDLKIDTKTTYNYENPMVDKNGRQYNENLKINEADVAGLYLENKVGEEYFERNSIKKERIEQIANTFKSILDNGVEQMESQVMKAGYAPIGRIENYFPHFLETKPDGFIGKISNFLGIRTKVQNLPTEIAGKTDTFKPGKTWNPNAMHRTGDITDINALKAMENYIHGASDVIYHTDDLQKLRALDRNIRQSYTDEETQKSIDNIRANDELTEDEKEEAIYNKLQNVKTEIPNFVTWLTEYTNILANKKSQADRSMEYNWGRSTYSTIQDIENKIASNTIGGNLSVALTNFAPLAQSMGTTKVGNVLIGMIETTKNTINESFGKGDGFADASDFLTRRRGTDTIHKQKASEKISNFLGKPMELVDEFTSEAIVRAKYRENIQNGMNEFDALRNADEYTANLMADRSKGALPTMFNSKNPVSKLINMFQIEPNNVLSNYTKDWRNYSGNKAFAVTKLAIASYAFNTILKSIRGGSDILPDPINIVSNLIKMITSQDDDDKKKAQDEVISSFLGSIPFGNSAVNIANMLGIDMPDSVQNSGRVPIANAIPSPAKIGKAIFSESDEYRNQELYKELIKPLLYLGLPSGGAQINKTIEGIKAYTNKGSYKYNSKGERILQFPVQQNATNLLKTISFGKYSTKEGMEYATDFNSLNAKQTKLYDETNIDFNDLKKYIKENKKTSDLEKIEYIEDMNISNDDKVKLYQYNVLSEKQSESLDYAIKNNLTTKGSFEESYKKLASKEISFPTQDDVLMMNSNNISLEDYTNYKVATKGMTKESEKNQEILKLDCDTDTKKAIYECTTGKDDNTYQALKNIISIESYLDYKSQKFEASKDANGKTISGSRKAKIINYVNNSSMSYEERLLILGINNKLSSGERAILFNYINNKNLTAKEKLEAYSMIKGFTVNGNYVTF